MITKVLFQGCTGGMNSLAGCYFVDENNLKDSLGEEAEPEGEVSRIVPCRERSIHSKHSHPWCRAIRA
jgi:hypothetical protein